jgi:predicted nuclease of predicted toxin-antitoxin system
MRFFLDEGVDAECRTILTTGGHEAWTVGQARRSGADDADQLVYAHDNDAVLVVDDKGFARSRLSMPIGRIVHLKGPQYRAAELLGEALTLIVPVLEHNPDMVIRLSRLSNGSINVAFRFGTEHRRRPSA